MCEWWVAGRVSVSRGARGRRMCVAVAGAVRVAGAAAMRTFLVNGLFFLRPVPVNGKSACKVETTPLCTGMCADTKVRYVQTVLKSRKSLGRLARVSISARSRQSQVPIRRGTGSIDVTRGSVPESRHN